AAPSSAKARAPVSVIAPPSAQAASIQAGEGTAASTCDGVRKIPEPIEAPVATRTRSNRVRRFANSAIGRVSLRPRPPAGVPSPSPEVLPVVHAVVHDLEPERLVGPLRSFPVDPGIRGQLAAPLRAGPVLRPAHEGPAHAAPPMRRRDVPSLDVAGRLPRIAA